MTSDTMFDRDLPAVLEGLYLGPSPDYRDAVLAVATDRRQRPSWTFLGRWLPVTDVAYGAGLGQGLPWRAIALALVVIALLVAAALVAASHQTKLPSPFGVARNGSIAYSYGDIYTVDPATGASTAIITGPANDSRPLFSRDGTKVAFLRASSTSYAYDLMVAGADGSGVRTVLASPIAGLDAAHVFDYEWAPDSRSLIVYAEPQILRVDAVGSAKPTVLTADAVATGRLGPSGLIPYQPASIHEDAIWTVGIDGTAPRQLIHRSAADSSDGDLSFVRYSPDGSMLAFEQNLLPGDPDQRRIFVARTDGTHAHRLTDATGPAVESNFAWSPDSRHIAFNRLVPADPAKVNGDWEPRPIGIAAVNASGVASPIMAAGTSQGIFGAVFEWSPDGSMLIAFPGQPGDCCSGNKPTIIDVATGVARPLDVTVNAFTSWQRIAP